MLILSVTTPFVIVTERTRLRSHALILYIKPFTKQIAMTKYNSDIADSASALMQLPNNLEGYSSKIMLSSEG